MNLKKRIYKFEIYAQTVIMDGYAVNALQALPLKTRIKIAIRLVSKMM